MRGRNRHTLDSHGLKINFPTLNPFFQRVSVSSLNEVHSKRNNKNDKKQCTDHDQDKSPRGRRIRGSIQSKTGPYSQICCPMNIVEMSYFFAMRSFSDDPGIQAQLFDNLLTFSTRNCENRKMAIRSPCAPVSDIPQWGVAFLWLIGGVVGFVEYEGFDRSL